MVFYQIEEMRGAIVLTSSRYVGNTPGEGEGQKKAWEEQEGQKEG